MTRVVGRGAGRREHAERSAKHAQRTALPQRKLTVERAIKLVVHDQRQSDPTLTIADAIEHARNSITLDHVSAVAGAWPLQDYDDESTAAYRMVLELSDEDAATAVAKVPVPRFSVEQRVRASSRPNWTDEPGTIIFADYESDTGREVYCVQYDPGTVPVHRRITSYWHYESSLRSGD